MSSNRVTSVDIAEYLKQIVEESRASAEEDDGFRTTKQIAEGASLNIRVTRELLNELDVQGLLEIRRIKKRVLGGYNRPLHYRLRVEEETIDDLYKE